VLSTVIVVAGGAMGPPVVDGPSGATGTAVAPLTGGATLAPVAPLTAGSTVLPAPGGIIMDVILLASMTGSGFGPEAVHQLHALAHFHNM